MTRPAYKTIGIHVVRCMLSDESYVYNVRIGQGPHLRAVTEKDAIALADKIRDAILAHTSENPDVVFNY